MLNNVKELVLRAKGLEKYHVLKSHLGLTCSEIFDTESALTVKLSEDFKSISDEFSYEIFLGLFAFWTFGAELIEFNNYYRKELKNLEKILILSCDDNGAVLMFTQDSPEKHTPIVWCDYEDLYNYSETGEFKYKIDRWDSFTDFFEYLVEQEEKAQEEEKNQPETIKTVLPEKKSFWKQLFSK